MSSKTLAVLASTPAQVLTGSYHIKRLAATGTAGAVMNLYDAVGAKTWTAPALTLKNINNTFTRTDSAVVDCAGIPRDYTHAGIGYTTDTTRAGGSENLPIIYTVIPNQASVDVDLVVSRGLWAEVVSGSGTDTVTVVVDYENNLALNPP